MTKILVVIDYQKDFTDGALGSPDALKFSREIEDKVSESLDSGDCVYLTLDTHGEDYMTTQEGRNLPVPHCIRGTEGIRLNGRLEEIVRGRDNAFKVSKDRFGSPDLPSVIRATAGVPDEIEVCGVVTDICVLSNSVILKSAFPEARIWIDASCCSGTSRENHEKTLDLMGSIQIEVRNRGLRRPFDAKRVMDEIVEWLAEAKERTGAKGFVVGISGGKDSSVAAALLKRAVGAENVLGVLMPNGEQPDIADSEDLCRLLGIRSITANIAGAYNGVISALGKEPGSHTKTNIPPRIRMTILYAAAQDRGYLVCGTGNASEKHIGYFTKWGDGAFDLNPLGNLDTDEVIAVGEAAGLPERFTRKPPSDGLCGKTDEENIGFTYGDLNRYIKTGECENQETKEKIDRMHAASEHKRRPAPVFEP